MHKPLLACVSSTLLLTGLAWGQADGVEVQKLMVSPTASFATFGRSVDLEGDVALITANRADQKGAAYTFPRHGAVKAENGALYVYLETGGLRLLLRGPGDHGLRRGAVPRRRRARFGRPRPLCLHRPRSASRALAGGRRQHRAVGTLRGPRRLPRRWEVAERGARAGEQPAVRWHLRRPGATLDVDLDSRGPGRLLGLRARRRMLASVPRLGLLPEPAGGVLLSPTRCGRRCGQ
jgi:hypothetical protein